MIDKINSVIESVKASESLLANKQATIGFDGFIDNIVHVVKSKKDKNNFTLFQDISEFSSYLAVHEGKSCTLELNEDITKIGGNMPILSTALGRLGVNVNCIGAMGYPELKREFKNMILDNCTLCSIADPGYTTALEFDDGKIMLAKMGSIDEITWEKLKTALDIAKLICFFQDSDLLGIVNWSEIEGSSGIWEGILNEVLPQHIPNKKQIVYFDLSDCSKKHKDDIMHALYLMRQFSAHYKVILGMNENESMILYKALFPEEDYESPFAAGSRMFEKLGIDMLVIHPRHCAIAWEKDKSCKINNCYIEKPKISTGGGDNFNAGFCIGLLLELDTQSSLILASAVSSFYVKNGYSPNNGQLINFLKEWKENII